MLEHAAIWRAGVFFGIILALIALERLIPRRRLSQKHSLRWVSNFGIFIVDAVVTRLPLAASGMAIAAYAEWTGRGLLHWLGMDPASWLTVVLAIIVLDFAVWLQHVMSHRWNWFWRLHRVHHSDLDIDVTTALRFHPGEIFVSLVYKSAVIFLLGAPLMAVLIFEIILNGCAMFNHSNIKLSLWLDKLIRPILVTPDMHRVHHSTRAREHNHNYGFCLSWWDRLFRLYTAQPKDGHEGMEIGLPEFRDSEAQTFGRLLTQPLK